MSEYRLRSILRTDVPTVAPHSPIRAAVSVLVEAKADALAVLDHEAGLIGILTQKDCFRPALHAAYYQDWSGRVASFMSRHVVTLDIENELMVAAHMFLTRPYRVYPVVEGTRYAGLLHRSDALALLAVSADGPLGPSGKARGQRNRRTSPDDMHRAIGVADHPPCGRSDQIIHELWPVGRDDDAIDIMVIRMIQNGARRMSDGDHRFGILGPRDGRRHVRQGLGPGFFHMLVAQKGIHIGRQFLDDMEGDDPPPRAAQRSGCGKCTLRGFLLVRNQCDKNAMIHDKPPF